MRTSLSVLLVDQGVTNLRLLAVLTEVSGA